NTMVKFETAYKSKELKAHLITAEYSAAYSEKDFNAYPAISFPLISCFDYKSAKKNFVIDTNHILFEKGEIEFTVSKYSTFKKDATLSIQFLKPNGELADFFTRSKTHIMLQKRNLQTEILLRRFLPVAFGKDETFKEQILLDIINKIVFINGNSPQQVHGKPYSIKQIDQSKDFIHAHYHDDLRIAEIASAANLSPFHFSRLFREITGYAPYDYLLMTRIEHAKTLIETGVSVTQTSFSIGFNSLENFSFAFSRIVGTSASAYKKSKISKIL
ncbi:MAG: AraC family transcriptional regulator, partial [Bacteroidota bacterium]